MIMRKAAVGALVCAAVLATALPPAAARTAPAGTPSPRLRADSDVFLPNLDDDSRRCALRPGDLDRLDIAVDRRLAGCHDAADEIVNGPADAADLAPLRVLPTAVSEEATGRLTLPAAELRRVRLFVDRSGRTVPLGSGGALTAGELRSGVTLRLEGRDIVRDPARWDGSVTLTLSVTDHGRTGTDRLRMRVAPVLLQHDLQRARTVFAAAPGPGEGRPAEVPLADHRPTQWPEFASSLRAATRAAGLPGRALTFTPGTGQWWRDIWRQDIAEPGYVRMRTAHGEQTMRLLLRSPNHWSSAGGRAESLRRSGRLLYRDLRGPGVGVVQQYTADRDPGVDELLNFTGNVEALPPYRGHPHGRVVYGATEQRHPDRSFTTMLRAQGAQPPVVLDTSWLLAGHVDETVHVVRSGNARGWTLAVADPRLALRLLRQARDAGEGGQRMQADTVSPHKPTVEEFLAGERRSGFNEEVARRIDGQLAVLARETGLRSAELVRLPVLYADVPPSGEFRGGAVAFTPSLVNGLSLDARHYAAPDPHGPTVAGRDLFREVTRERLAANGVRVHWVEDFGWAHLSGGEVHCATNALREIGAGPGAGRPGPAGPAAG
ncbi:protein-arginine deiminase family protein [Streptomyces sp. NPDC018031]|uniref:protein-arginine deiminase family protein n=1 Tax=Streptomyces sp. NPDC018031 TaxID=3365033 RepID=UPI0037A6F555